MAPVTFEKKGKMGYQTDLGMNPDEKVVVENVDDHQNEKVKSQAEMAVVADEVGNGNAATEDAKTKKNRKKKEKLMEKKAAAATASATPVAKPVEKKLPKHVIKWQEELAKLKEAEGRKNREEEEKLKIEEEEFLRQEAVKRIEQEKKRLKKEREKDNRTKKKQEEEARRLEAKKNQLIRKGVVLPRVTAPTKRPIYTTNKRRQQANGTASFSNQLENDVYSVDADEDVDVGVETAEEKDISEAQKVVDVDEWDAVNWDDMDLQLPPVTVFADEDKATEPEPITKRETNESQRTTKKSQQDFDKGKTTVEIEECETTLRSPVCCVMGHVDAGKTKLLDSIKRTNVQKTEAGGITQQISATYIPTESIRERTKNLKADAKIDVAGLLVIDTPGHESFNNLRSRGSSLCDVAILVVDITNGLQPQTIESIKLLKMENTDVIENDKPAVVVALNKVDRLYGWKTFPDVPIANALKLQSSDVQLEFKDKVTKIITQFKEQGVNTELFYKNKDRVDTYSIVPTSAISGQGIPELLLLLVQWAQKTMIEKLTYRSDLVEGTVMEVKVTEGLGTTIDVILVNGVLHKGDEIVVCGFKGPIHTTIRSLLTPPPVKELHIKGDYIYHKEIKAAQVIKITAQNLEHAVAGTALYVVRTNDDLARYKKLVVEDMKTLMSRIDKHGRGVYVQASTLGSLEAFIVFLNSQDANIPVGDIGIGPIHKKDVLKASVMSNKREEFSTILALDVKVTPEARELADKLEVKIFTDDVIFQLYRQFKDYYDSIKEEKKINAAADAVFPCVLKPNDVLVSKKPIILGVEVLQGTVKVGTPICIIPKKAFCVINDTYFDPAEDEKQKVKDPIDIGRITSIRINDRDVNSAQKGQEVSIKIEGSNFEFKKDFKKEEGLCSRISRNSIDVLKEHYLDELSREEKVLVNKLRKILKVL